MERTVRGRQEFVFKRVGVFFPLCVRVCKKILTIPLNVMEVSSIIFLTKFT